ncbi:6,7-dimethyl-8-ribityllumazine synthase [Legionella nagasakiensis]|uniref:6,7-dimethyl-8-ribityllumazine synthase n=1 Tax=Legionella nagasakiensis TaxID=535290 RepID=UPI001056C9D2|nr:6,7-dimethyl-8-ribityllumazine synthase [Legionella nagasakiensis]
MRHIKGIVNERGQSFPIAIVVSNFNQDITHKLMQGAIKRLLECGFNQEDITVVEVPGAIEIPMVAQRLAKQAHCDVIIALGAVIRGETTHYDYVCQQVSDGCQQVALTYDIPIIFGVLTTENEAQAWDRLGGQHGHKGIDAANSALLMYSALRQLSE